MPLDPEVAASLDAIDATLAGEPVDPAHAELAEVALLLAADRPAASATLARTLDARVQRRFASPPEPAAKKRRFGRWWLWTPAAGLAAALGVAIVVVFAGGGGSTSSSMNSASSSGGSLAVPSPAVGTAKRTAAAAGAAASHSAESASSGNSPASSAATTAAGQPLSQQLGQTSPVLQPPPSGRKIIQGGQLSLITAPAHIDDVAQEIFVVIGEVHGIVNGSTVTASGGPGGYAQFQLSIPSGSLPQTMASLSSLRYARVSSRTDTTQDVNDQYQADVQRLADARALRSSLLKQLENAVTQGQIDSLTTQIHDAEAAISSDQATLNSLNRQIGYSQVNVTINGGVVTPVATQSNGSGSGFTFGRAAHDAGRVLTVAAGVALIGLAALVPVLLIGALAWWAASVFRRRRREQALDVV
jgi:hypothetical protein